MNTSHAKIIIRLILAILCIGIIVESIYLESLTSVISYNIKNSQCKICAQEYSLRCTEKPVYNNLYARYARIHNIKLTYLDCQNDMDIHYCTTCYSDELKALSAY